MGRQLRHQALAAGVSRQGPCCCPQDVLYSQPVHTVLRSYLALLQGAPKDVLGFLRQYADILCIEIVSRLDVFQFDDFLSLDAVQVASPELLRALNCVAREDMKGLRKLQADVPTLASVHGIDMKLLEEKMRLLSFASAASSKVSLVLVFRITIYIVL